MHKQVPTQTNLKVYHRKQQNYAETKLNETEAWGLILEKSEDDNLVTILRYPPISRQIYDNANFLKKTQQPYEQS